MSSALEVFAKNNPNLAEFNVKRGMVKFKADLTFAPGKADVNLKASEALSKLVEILNSDSGKGFYVYVAGHTDDMRIGRPETKRRHPDNWYLSAHRAIGVKKELEKSGMAPQRIAVIGFGEYHPVAPNQPNKKGNAANRRVEIWIVPSGLFLTNQSK